MAAKLQEATARSWRRVAGAAETDPRAGLAAPSLRSDVERGMELAPVIASMRHHNAGALDGEARTAGLFADAVARSSSAKQTGRGDARAVVVCAIR